MGVKGLTSLQARRELDAQVELVKPNSPPSSSLRCELYFFASLDMVGSTALKNMKLDFPWIKVVEHFYRSCENLTKDNGFAGSVWKYIGDEILFYQKITEFEQIETSIRGIFRSMEEYEITLKEDGELCDVSKFVSIKGVAWLAPIRKNIVGDGNSSIDAKHRELCSRWELGESSDQIFGTLREDGGKSEPFDFLGPNIDLGFRISKFARRRQLVLSAALAYYLLKSNHGANNLHIVDFDELKGIGKGKLYPGIWYNENWSAITAVRLKI